MPVEVECSWCGKRISVHPYRSKHSIITCSKECQYKMLGKFMKEKWANLTPEKRDEWQSKLGKGERNGKGFIEYYKSLRPEKVKKVLKMMGSPTGYIPGNDRYTAKGKSSKLNPRLDGDDWMPNGACTMIAAHHEMLKNDPERLTTAFIEKMCGIDCKCKVKDKKVKDG